MTDQIDMIYQNFSYTKEIKTIFSVDGFDINQSIRKILINHVDLISHFDFLTMINLFGLSFLLFTSPLSSGSKLLNYGFHKGYDFLSQFLQRLKWLIMNLYLCVI